MLLEAFNVVVAKQALGIFDIGGTIDAADRLLENGIYTYSLGELATGGCPTGKGPPRLLTDAVQELGLALPTREEALTTLARHYIGRIAEGGDDPFAGIVRIWHECYKPLELTDANDDFLATCHGLDFRRWYYQYDVRLGSLEIGFPSREEAERELAAQRQRILAESQDWIRKHYHVQVKSSWLIWKGGTVLRLAQSIIDDGAFDRLPILADALEDAGCDTADILAHCRGGGEHVRCCWVVDLLLGKS
jgi:hypothetical protein